MGQGYSEGLADQGNGHVSVHVSFSLYIPSNTASETLRMDIRNVGLDSTVLSILEDMLDLAEEPEKEKGKSNPSRAYVRDAKAMAAATPADVAEYPNCYVFVVDMPQR
ncbi:hypothetical protein JHK85_009399 [Glycine max]|nr:hypothetical protein JHK85_009399 [Glycine max]